MAKKQDFLISEYKQSGLPQKKATKLLKEFGLNKVIGKKAPSDFFFFINQFKNPLVLVLLIAIGITILIGDYKDAVIIGLAVIINAALGFIQERKAYKSLESLKKVVTLQTYVIRDSQKQLINVENLVPGDIVLMYEGDKVPADGLVLENTDLLVDEALLTGESVPVIKQNVSLPQQLDSLEEILSKNAIELFSKLQNENKVFMGTIVTAGLAKVLITQTGMETQLGNIAANIEENKQNSTPLEKKLDALARMITFGVIVLSVLIFAIGMLTKRDPGEMFTTAVAIAVAAIPEGLVIGLTAILAVGMNKILKRKGLVRSLLAAETLGSVTTVCLDKTGTLTEGKMQVADFDTKNEKLLYKTSTLANDRKDPIELARWNWAKNFSAKNDELISPEEVEQKNQRTAEIPFSGERRFLAVQVKNEIFISGAPEEILSRSKITPTEAKKITKKIETLASEGRRLIGFGYIKLNSQKEATSFFKDLKKAAESKKITWVGLMSFTDPVRKNVAAAMEATRKAGIQVKVITGDYSSTAVSVMKEIGIAVSPDEIMLGEDVEKISQRELREKLSKIRLFARTKPAQKLKIVKALKENGEIVAMMGDGINDAPALATADIGVVVENATEVAKESSELVLLDSNMQTIVAAIEEGRAMYQNLKKVMLYLLSDSFAELILVFISILTNTPLPITAAQILFINLLSDGLPNLALTIDPKEDDLLTRKPIHPSKRLLDKDLVLLILLVSITAAISGLIVFNFFIALHGIELARTMVFAILSVDSLLYVYSCRSLEKNIWQQPLFNNKPLVLATFVGLLLNIAAIHHPFFQNLLQTTDLSINQWMVVLLVSCIEIGVIELFKLIRNKSGWFASNQ